MPATRRVNFDMASVVLTAESLAEVDVVVFAIEHTSYDQTLILKHAPLIIDTRNAMAGLYAGGKVVKA